MKAIQFIDSFPTEDRAQEAFDGLKLQDTYMGGRILPPSPTKGPEWRVQAFFEAFDHDFSNDWLPDGCRIVTLLKSQFATLGIENVRLA